MHLQKISCVALAALFCGTASISASAGVISFDQANAASPTGTVSYDGNGGALVGSGISFDQVSLNQGSVPAGNENTLSCSGCKLTFNTGSVISEGSPSNNNIWSFSGGGSLTMSGTAEDSNGNVIASGDLFSGSFVNSADGTTQLALKTGTSSLNVSTYGVDEFNTDLANYLGLNSSSGFAFSNTEIALSEATFGADGSFTSGRLSNADLNILPTTSQAVPEPQEIGMFAIGLLMVLGALGVRRKNNANIG